MGREKLSFLITIALLCTTPAFAAGGRVYPESATQVIGSGGTEQDFKKHGGNITHRGTITIKDAVLTPVK